jgi:hypothetical protein
VIAPKSLIEAILPSMEEIEFGMTCPSQNLFKVQPNFTSINPLERVASWSYTIVKEIISFESEEVNH